ncbi:MAG: hypothetical protein ACK5L0_01220 [Candidatus Fimivivens sp.]
MVNYNKSANSIKNSTATNLKPTAQPLHVLLPDMSKSTGSQYNARLSINSLKRDSATAQPSYSNTLSLPAQSPGKLPAEFTEIRHQNLSVAHKDKTITSAFSGKTISTPKTDRQPDQLGCNLVACSHEGDMTAEYPQSDALATIISGQSISFGEPLLSENTAIEHQAASDTFIIKETGIYALHYRLSYEARAPHLLILGFENFPQSYFKQPMTNVPTRGRVNTTVRLLLEAGTVLRFVLIDGASLPTVESALISNAMLEIKLLYRLNLNCAVYSSESGAKNFQSENHVL